MVNVQTVSAINARKALKEFLLEKSLACLHQARGLLKHSFVTPTYSVSPGADDKSADAERSTAGLYLQMYDWDSYFFSQAAKYLAHPELPLEVLENFLALTGPDGYIPRTVSPGRIWDKGDLCKPFLCQMLWEYCQGAANDPDLTGYLEKLEQYLSYWQKNRRHESGLYFWRNVLESGVDNNLALIYPQEAAKDENSHVSDFPDGELLAVDLNVYLVQEFSAFSRLSTLAGRPEAGDEYNRRALKLAKLIESRLWLEDISMYANLDPRSGELVAIRSWTGLLPVFFGLAERRRAEEVIAKNIACPGQFLQPTGISSLSSSERLYNQASRGLYGRVLVSNWQGPTWVLPNVLCVRALLNIGNLELAEEIAYRIVNTLGRDVLQNGTLHENYHAESGQPLWAPQFISWNVLALELIDLIS